MFFKWNVRSSYGHEESGRERDSGLCTDCRYFGGHCTWTDNGIIFRTVTFMLSIGMAIIYNLGSNYFMGEISYITKALAAVLQLGVTLDYSIFLMHSYEEQQVRYDGDKNRAMAHAISQTFSSVMGSSITTIAGFIALCFMSFTLGLDIGIVMVKGVIFGVIACVTILPSMILCCDKIIEDETQTIPPGYWKNF